MQSRPAVCRSCGCHKSLRVPFRLASTAKRTPRSHDSEKWVTVVGLEIHAQIKTNRKLFSPASTSYNDPPNTQTERFDAALPGALPILNREAIRLGVVTALALGCTVNPRSTFDRKHYFYHDIPASYQITQRYNPLARSGRLKLSEGDHGIKRSFNVGIQQVQIEQDTAKSQVVGDKRLVDLNRAGTGLMEIVTDPDMRSAEEAGAFVRRLQSLLRRVGSGDGDMEKGNLRVDANVSVHRAGLALGTRCEIKNLNSIRFLQQAIEYERQRQIKHYQTSSTPLQQETRGLNELTGETFSLRTKEEAEDYRYMPDSNLPAMVIAPTYLEKIQNTLPEMPWDAVARLTAMYGVPKRDVETLVGLEEYGLQGIRYFEEVIGRNEKIGKKALNWIVHELLGQLYKSNKPWSAEIVPSILMRELVSAVEDGKMTGTTGKAIISHLISISPPVPPSTSLLSILKTLGLEPTSSDDLQKTCQAVIAALPAEAEAVRSGKLNVVGRIIGEVMKISNGRADAKQARSIIMELLKV